MLIWESTNLLLLIPVVIRLVMLVRWLQGKGGFTGARLASALRPLPRESLHSAYGSGSLPYS